MIDSSCKLTEKVLPAKIDTLEIVSPSSTPLALHCDKFDVRDPAIEWEGMVVFAPPLHHVLKGLKVPLSPRNL